MRTATSLPSPRPLRSSKPATSTHRRGDARQREKPLAHLAIASPERKRSGAHLGGPHSSLCLRVGAGYLPRTLTRSVTAAAVYGEPADGTYVAVTRVFPRGHLRGVFHRYPAIPSSVGTVTVFTRFLRLNVNVTVPGTSVAVKNTSYSFFFPRLVLRNESAEESELACLHVEPDHRSRLAVHALG